MNEFEMLRIQLQKDYDDMMLGFTVQRDTIRQLDKNVQERGDTLTRLHQHVTTFIDRTEQHFTDHENRIRILERKSSK